MEGDRIMKKLLTALTIVLSIGLISCGGSKEFTPTTEGEYNIVYRNTTNKEVDGQYPVINVASIEKEESTLIVNIGAPTLEQLEYSVANLLYVQPMDSKGEAIDFDNFKLVPVQDGTIEAKLRINGIKTDEVKWLEIGPYKINDTDKLIYKVE